MDRKRILERAALFTSVLALGACTTTVTIPASDLPELGPATGPAPAHWPVVHTKEEGDKTLKGTVEEVRLSTRGGTWPIYLPMKARIEGDALLVNSPLGPQAFRLQDVGPAEVTYYDKEKVYKMPGGTLVGVGSPFLVTGLVLFVAGLSEGGFGGGVATLVGLSSTGVGLAFFIPGVVLLSLDPKPPGAQAASAGPRLEVGPGGMRFSTTF